MRTRSSRPLLLDAHRAAGVVVLALSGALAFSMASRAQSSDPAQAHLHNAPADARMLTSPLALTPADFAAGKLVYEDRCASCHGIDGTSRTSMAARLAVRPAVLARRDLAEHTDGELFWVITHGAADRGMPAFHATLSDEARWQVVAHVRTLDRSRAPTLADAGIDTYPWELPPGFPRPRVPADNPMTVEKVELGRHLFFDRRLSVDGTFSCDKCHEPARAFTDDKVRAVGVTGEVHPRNSMSLVNIGYSPVLTWANPTQTRLETQALVPMFGEAPVEMGLAGRDAQLLQMMGADARYRQLFSAAFPGEENPVTLANVTRALASFERTIISGDAPYDRYRSGRQPDAISESAKRGEVLFFDERTECFHCHGGFNFTETVDHRGLAFPQIEFHNTGLYNLDSRGAYPADNTGVMAISHHPSDMGRFKAPTLRNIAVTAPYMHDGSIATLSEVIDHYAAGGRAALGAGGRPGAASPLKSTFIKGFPLTPQERADLVAFLESLTDRSFLENPRFRSPW